MSVEQQNTKLVEIYRFLAQSLKYPDSDWLNNSYWSVLTTLLTELDWAEDREALEAWHNSISDFLEDLQIEHTRLFINAVPHVLAPPYASIYAHVDGTLYGPIAEKTKDFYKEKGYTIAQGEIPDHIVLELEFLAILVEQDEEGYETFLDTLFYPWFSKFEEKVLQETEHPFFRIIVKLIDFFTREES